MKILLVDDDELVRYSLAKALRQADHEVEEMESGLRVPLTLEKFQPDILITDIIMPDKEGLGVIMETRASHPNLPIIAISGGGRLTPKAYLSDASALGAHAVLQKPVDHNELISHIERLT